ncbi:MULTISPECIES: hypothetical protein [Halolamina]|uniref:Uncharacterized protein n=1 Tax=Halolamina pelagica TaxID=699431 RepID=A0A1I5P4P8_9EURY|nr:MULTISPECIES: hypothetical protein [Halolamina]NHX36618.1 hypothetical protein [Halolamina sp. R1-12]SFP28810.1 hypothetical protein SAMN05216277_102339 [Halolamina pelagica]
MTRTTLTRREALRVGGAAALAGIAGCSGGVGGNANATVYGEWTPERDGTGAEPGGESMWAMEPVDLAETRYALGDRTT